MRLRRVLLSEGLIVGACKHYDAWNLFHQSESPNQTILGHSWTPSHAMANMSSHVRASMDSGRRIEINLRLWQSVVQAYVSCKSLPACHLSICLAVEHDQGMHRPVGWGLVSKDNCSPTRRGELEALCSEGPRWFPWCRSCNASWWGFTLQPPWHQVDSPVTALCDNWLPTLIRETAENQRTSKETVALCVHQ